MAWHELYDDPSSVLSGRLRLVQAQLEDALDHAPAGPIRLLSLCAGQGRDVTGVLRTHPRRDDVSAVLIEANAENAETARRNAAAAGLPQVEVRQADAAGPAATPRYSRPTCCCCADLREPQRRRHPADDRRGPSPQCPRRHRDLDPAPPPAGPHSPGASLVPGGQALRKSRSAHQKMHRRQRLARDGCVARQPAAETATVRRAAWTAQKPWRPGPASHCSLSDRGRERWAKRGMSPAT